MSQWLWPSFLIQYTSHLDIQQSIVIVCLSFNNNLFHNSPSITIDLIYPLHTTSPLYVFLCTLSNVWTLILRQPWFSYLNALSKADLTILSFSPKYFHSLPTIFILGIPVYSPKWTRSGDSLGRVGLKFGAGNGRIGRMKPYVVGSNDFVYVLPDLSVVQNLNLSKVLQSRIVRVLTSYGTTRYDRGKLAETRRYGNYRYASVERQSCATR